VMPVKIGQPFRRGEQAHKTDRARSSRPHPINRRKLLVLESLRRISVSLCRIRGDTSDGERHATWAASPDWRQTERHSAGWTGAAIEPRGQAALIRTATSAAPLCDQ
jgi:hypothetical protein